MSATPHLTNVPHPLLQQHKPSYKKPPTPPTLSSHVPSSTKAPSSTPPTKLVRRPTRITASTDHVRRRESGELVTRPPTHYLINLDPRPPNANHACVFCKIKGSVPECEGDLMGPFIERKANRTVHYYTHTNCALWHPLVFEKNKKLHNILEAIKYARGKPCYGCKKPGATLGCNHNGKKCCRSAHFRCALLVGTTLFNFQVRCPKHAHFSFDRASLLSYADHTPIDIRALRYANTCLYNCGRCTYDIFNPNDKVLTCIHCFGRSHVTCTLPAIGGKADIDLQMIFFKNSSKRRHSCEKCMPCGICGKRVDQRAYAIRKRCAKLLRQSSNDTQFASTASALDSSGNGIVELDLTQESNEDCNVLLCVGCNHYAVHIDCVLNPPLKKLSNTQSLRWRCDLCYVCRHCNKSSPKEEWNEHYEACQTCYRTIKKDGGICPVCNSLYREDEGNKMVQCDDCDGWVHAEICGGLTLPQFKALNASSRKYYCPVCVHKREAARKRGRFHHGILGERLLTFGDEYPKFLSKILEKLPPPQPEKAFYITQLVNKDNSDSSVKELHQLAVGIDICSLCCTSTANGKARYCITCGDFFHEHCSISTDAGGITMDLPGSGRKVWQCKTCSVHWNIETELVKNIDTHEQQKLLTNGSVTPKNSAAASAAKGMTNEAKGMTNEAKGTANEAKGTANEAKGMDNETKGMANEVNGSACEASGKASEGKMMVQINGNGASKPRRKRRKVVNWEDHRRCEFCNRCEHRGAPEGPLVPWSSSMNWDLCDVWVHVGCVLLAPGMTLRQTGELFTIFGPRRTVMTAAKRTKCVKCGKAGATVRCTSKGCGKVYHFHCAVDSKMNGMAKVTSTKKSQKPVVKKKKKGLTMAEIEGMEIVCQKHFDRKSKKRVPLRLEDVPKIIGSGSLTRVIDSQGYLVNPEAHKKRLVSMNRVVKMRVGALAIASFGEIVPDVNEFLVDGCLVPLGYCGVRRFWSTSKVGKRCTYFFEVNGNALSRPRFVIRCSDDLSFRHEGEVVDDVWGVVWRKAMEVQLGIKLKPSVLCRRGLDVMGLACSDAIVRHVESLPLANMFKGRYTNKFTIETTNDIVPFYRSLATKYTPPHVPLNTTDSARVEGYRRPPTNALMVNVHVDTNGPMYENMRTGASFQMQVARELLHINAGQCKREDAPLRPDLVTTIVTHSRERPRPTPGGDPTTVAPSTSSSSSRRGRRPPSGATTINLIEGDESTTPSANTVAPARTRVKSDDELGGVRKVVKKRRRSGRKPAVSATKASKAKMEDIKVKMEDTEEITTIDLSTGMYAGTNGEATSANHSNTDDDHINKNKNKNNSNVIQLPPLPPLGRVWPAKDKCLAPNAKRNTIILRSEIDGWGVFATQDIGAGELIIEYVGEIIRPSMSDLRERRYLEKGVGCYMFEIVPGEIIDATMCGNAARYINHSCVPNCHSKTVWAGDGVIQRRRQVVAIFSKRGIQRGEELSYDYQFPYDETDRVACECGAEQCKGFMN